MRHTRYLLTLKGRPPFCLAGMETYERLQNVAQHSLDLLAKRGLVPYRCHATLEGREGRELVIDLQVGGMDQMTADHVGECLRQIIGVNAVLMSRVVR